MDQLLFLCIVITALDFFLIIYALTIPLYPKSWRNKVNKKYKNETFAKVIVQKNVIIGSGSIILPGVEIAEGCSIGAMTLVNKSTRPWSVYAGIPGKKVKRRNKNLLNLQRQFLKEVKKN